MKLLLYCTKGKIGLYDNRKKITGALENFFLDKLGYDKPPLLNGKIVAECDFEVEEIIANDVNLYDEYGIKYTIKNGYSDIDDNFEALLNDSCLNAFELNDYLGGYGGYAIHIKNLKVFDKPKELSEYYHLDTYMLSVIKKAPQNMMYVVDNNDEKKVLISIHSEWLCKILNGEKTIEVRKKVLKEMIK